MLSYDKLKIKLKVRMNMNKPIGVIDSGVEIMTVAKEIMVELPNETN